MTFDASRLTIINVGKSFVGNRAVRFDVDVADGVGRRVDAPPGTLLYPADPRGFGGGFRELDVPVSAKGVALVNGPSGFPFPQSTQVIQIAVLVTGWALAQLPGGRRPETNGAKGESLIIPN